MEGKAPEGQLGHYPLERLKRVDQPTTYIGPNVHRVSEYEAGFLKAGRGEYGPRLKAEASRFVSKEPVAAVLSQMVGDLGSCPWSTSIPRWLRFPRIRLPNRGT